jgi:hypothetical protein
MEPQCTTAAQCHRELARVMEQFGIEDSVEAVNSNYIINCGNTFGSRSMPKFFSPEEWQFAIAEVEGKPVFIGDTASAPDGQLITLIGVGHDCRVIFTDRGSFYKNQISLNPPKPKTVMVEMRREVAEFLAREQPDYLRDEIIEASKSCAKALSACDKAANLKESE